MRIATMPGSSLSTTFRAPDGEAVAVRALRPTDRDRLLEFFRRIPADDRQYLKDDVTDPAVVQRWTRNLDYRRVLPLVALAGDKIVGDATLHRDPAPDRRHRAHLRVLIDPAYRNLGLGRFLLRRLVETAIADDSDLEKIVLEVVADTEQAARHTAKALGFVEAREYSEYIHFYGGTPHDLVVMEFGPQAGLAEEPAEPARYMY